MDSKLLRENLIKAILFACALSSIGIVFFIVIFLFNNGYPAIIHWFAYGFNSLENMNIIAYTVNSLYLALGGTVVALIIGIPCSIYLAEFADIRLRNIIKPALEVLNGFPSIVIGFLGLYIISDNFYSSFGIRAAGCLLLGWIVLGIMALPLVTSVSEDSLRAVPEELKEASLGIGATKWQTVRHVLMSSASAGIVTAIALAFANAIGETMAVYLVIGNANPPPLTLNPLVATNSITVLIATKATADTFQPGTPIYTVIFGAGVILFVVTALTNLLIRKVAGGRSDEIFKRGKKL